MGILRMITLGSILLSLALASVIAWVCARYETARRARSARFSRAYRAASILSNAAKHLEQYGTGRDFEFNNARHLLLYARDNAIRDMAEAR